jgi:hypothetical protein
MNSSANNSHSLVEYACNRVQSPRIDHGGRHAHGAHPRRGRGDDQHLRPGGHRAAPGARYPGPGALRAGRQCRRHGQPLRPGRLHDPRRRRQPRADHGRRHPHPEEFSFGPFLSARATSSTWTRSRASRSPAVPCPRSTAATPSAAWWPITTRAPNEYVSARTRRTWTEDGLQQRGQQLHRYASTAPTARDARGPAHLHLPPGGRDGDGRQRRRHGPRRTQADPQDIDTQTLNGKLSWSVRRAVTTSLPPWRTSTAQVDTTSSRTTACSRAARSRTHARPSTSAAACATAWPTATTAAGPSTAPLPRPTTRNP